MEEITEIMNRDYRTTKSVSMRCYATESSDKCDKCQNERQTKHFAKSHHSVVKRKQFSYYLILAISLYIMSSRPAEANPVRHQRATSHDEVDKINFINPSCAAERLETTNTLSGAELRERVRAVLESSRKTLNDTREYTDDYVKLVFMTNVSNQHNTWSHKKINWLHPHGKPLRIQFRGKVDEKHKAELDNINWTDAKIVEYLMKLYARFQRIGVGLQIVNKWYELASRDGSQLQNTEQVNISTTLFGSAARSIRSVMCDIKDILLDMKKDPTSDLDITPFVLDEAITLNHWMVYREYEILMSYSHHLLETMNKQDLHGK